MGKSIRVSRQSKEIDYVNLHVRFDKSFYEKLRTEATRRGWSMSLLINEIIKDHFEKKGE